MNYAEWVSPDTVFFESSQPLELEGGQSLENWQLAYRTWGKLNSAGSNAVLICHALTGSADADVWWPGVIGDGCALDPARDYIICSNVIGGCYGSTGPQNYSDGQKQPADFPLVTIRDMVAAQEKLIAHLGVKRLSLVVGPSLGGMQVLEWAAMYPERLAAIAPVGVSGRHSAWCIGTSEAQRQAIYRDPAWAGGNYTADSRPDDGFAVARMMAMLSYRSWENFESRFARLPAETATDEYAIGSYLNYQGAKITERFDPLSYVRLTQAMDSHDLARSRGGYFETLRSVDVPALIVAVTSDVLYPPREQEELSSHLPLAKLRYLDSPAGHDGFLIDTGVLGEMIASFRSDLASGKNSEDAAFGTSG